MKYRIQLAIIIGILILIGGGTALYKHLKLGFSFSPQEKVTVWTVEAHVQFEADGGPSEVSLNLPDTSDAIIVLEEKTIAKDFTFEIKENRAVWQADQVKGRQVIFFQTTAYQHSSKKVPTPAEMDRATTLALNEVQKIAAENIIEVDTIPDTNRLDLASRIISKLNDPANGDAKLLNTVNQKQAC